MNGLSEVPHLPQEQQKLLERRTFSFHPLSTVGHLDLWRILSLTWLPILIFVFTLVVLTLVDLRFSNAQLVSLIYWVGLIVLLFFPTTAFVVLLLGVVATILTSKVRWHAVVYWIFWPISKFVLCWLAVLLGSMLGNHLWFNNFYPHARYQTLQAYEQVDPATDVGTRLQDSGVVTFADTVGVDRSRTGCLKNGAIFCIAPIVPNGEVPVPGQEQSQMAASNFSAGYQQQYDLFMAGINCCDCPGEFRCGDWNSPMQLGGLRILDDKERQQFRLAAESWSSIYGKSMVHPVFFEWVANPVTVYNNFENRGYRLFLLALLSAPFGFILATVLLNEFLGLLCRTGVAAPLDASLAPTGGLGHKLGSAFLPEIYRDQPVQEDVFQPNPKYTIL